MVDAYDLDRRGRIFWRHVARRSAHLCWLWAGAVSRSGYGSAKWPPDRTRRAHRVAYELTYGPIPDGLHVLHRCDTPLCCNPAHLYLGTDKDNAADRIARSGGPAGTRRIIPTATRLLIAERAAAGDSVYALARDLGLPPSSVRRWARPAVRAAEVRARRQPCPRCGGPMTLDHASCMKCRTASREERWRNVMALWNDGLRGAEIAARLGMTPGSVWIDISRMREAGWPVPHRHKRRALV